MAKLDSIPEGAVSPAIYSEYRNQFDNMDSKCEGEPKVVIPLRTETPHFVVAIGNAFDGIALYGPFPVGERDSVIEHLDGNDEEWNVVEIEDPTKMGIM